MNVNVLHRWLKEHQRMPTAGCAESMPSTPGLPAFVPVPLPVPKPVEQAHEIRIELRKGSLAMVVTWPMCAVADLASWTTAVLK